MYTYKLKINKVKGRLNESVRRNGITLRIKSAKKLSKNTLFEKADSYLNENYGVRLVEGYIEDTYHDDMSNGVLDRYGKAKYNAIDKKAKEGANRVVDKMDIDVLKNDITKTIISYGLQTTDDEVEERIEIRKIGQSRLVSYPKKNIFSSDINININDKIDVDDIRNIVGHEANSILRIFERNLKNVRRFYDLKHVIKNTSDEISNLGIDYMNGMYDDEDLYDQFMYERGDIVKMFENYIFALENKIDNIVGKFIAHMKNYTKSILFDNPNRSTLIDKI